MINKQQFLNALKDSLRVVNVPKALSDEIQRDFNRAAEFVYDNFVTVDTSKWDAEDFIVFLKKTHALLASTLYMGKNGVPGEFRKDDLLDMRHNPKADYERHLFAPKIIHGATMFMKANGYSVEIIKNFIVAYHKYFHTLHPMPEHHDRSREFQKTLERFALQLGISISDKNFYDAQGKELPLTKQENSALNYIYRFFPDWEMAAVLMGRFANKMLNILQAPNEDAPAIFFHGFLQIKPFLDANGRLTRLITNAIRAKQEQSIINLNAPAARAELEYSISLDNDPTLESVMTFFREIPSALITLSVASEDSKVADEKKESIASLIQSLGHISTSEKEPLTTKQDIMNCFGAAFQEKYAARIQWKLIPHNGATAISLVGVRIKPADKAWFQKKLATTKIEHTWQEKADGDFQLIFTHADKSSFDMANILEASGCSSSSGQANRR